MGGGGKAEEKSKNVFCEDLTDKVIWVKSWRWRKELAMHISGWRRTHQRNSKCQGLETGVCTAYGGSPEELVWQCVPHRPTAEHFLRATLGTLLTHRTIWEARPSLVSFQHVVVSARRTLQSTPLLTFQRGLQKLTCLATSAKVTLTPLVREDNFQTSSFNSPEK